MDLTVTDLDSKFTKRQFIITSYIRALLLRNLEEEGLDTEPSHSQNKITNLKS